MLALRASSERATAKLLVYLVVYRPGGAGAHPTTYACAREPNARTACARAQSAPPIPRPLFALGPAIRVDGGQVDSRPTREFAAPRPSRRASGRASERASAGRPRPASRRIAERTAWNGSRSLPSRLGGAERGGGHVRTLTWLRRRSPVLMACSGILFESRAGELAPVKADLARRRAVAGRPRAVDSPRRGC